jgi:MarR family transcriptional regulator, organic hydroperoxide resistance regulator
MIRQRDLLIDQILEAQNRIMRAAQNATDASWLRLDLTMAQLKALNALHQHGELAIGHLAELLDIGLSAASILVEKLVRHLLVERREDPADRRRSVVRLTTGGEQLITQVREGSHQLFREWCGRLNSADLKSLARGLDALAQVVLAQSQVRASPKVGLMPTHPNRRTKTLASQSKKV